MGGSVNRVQGALQPPLNPSKPQEGLIDAALDALPAAVENVIRMKTTQDRIACVVEQDAVHHLKLMLDGLPRLKGLLHPRIVVHVMDAKQCAVEIHVAFAIHVRPTAVDHQLAAVLDPMVGVVDQMQDAADQTENVVDPMVGVVDPMAGVVDPMVDVAIPMVDAVDQMVGVVDPMDVVEIAANRLK